VVAPSAPKLVSPVKLDSPLNKNKCQIYLSLN
jgi:hypothetical protein